MCCLLHQCVPNFLISSLSFSYRRYFGVIIPHKKAAIFSARRSELIDVMDQTLHYLDPKGNGQDLLPVLGRSSLRKCDSIYWFITDRGPLIFHVRFTHSLLTLHYYILVCSILNPLNLLFTMKLVVLMCVLPVDQCTVVFRQFPWFCRTSSLTTCRSWVCSIYFGSRMSSFRREPDGSTHPKLPSMFLIRPSLFRVLWQELSIDTTVNIRSI